MTYPGQRTVDYAFDRAGQLTSLTDWANHTIQFDWTQNGQLQTQTDPNGVAQGFGYDAAGQLTSIQTTHGTSTLATYNYSFDAAGQLVSDTQPTTTQAGSTDHTYGYDLTGQLGAVASSTAGASTSGSYLATPAGSLTALPDGSTLSYNSPSS